ncbi:MAG: Ig-like domain-containing protein [Gemmatimonadaceae bacterium]
MDAATQRSFALGKPRIVSSASVVALFAGILAATSCDKHLTTAPLGVDRIVLTPTAATMQVGTTLTLSASVLDVAGHAMRDRRVVWASEKENIATVSQSGVVVALVPGDVRIAASSGGKSASATITVTARPVSLVRITPGSATIAVGSSIPLRAEALDASGAEVLGRPVTWSSSNETIAVVSTTGIVAGLAAGSVTITATIDGRAGTAAISVAPQPVASVTITPAVDSAFIGERVTFRATALDAQNRALPDRFVLWSSNNPAVATVSSDGEVIALALGSARIRATVEGVSADAMMVVTPVPVANIAVAPNQVTLNPGQTSQLTVTLRDSAGNVLLGRAISYATSDAQIATVSVAGLIVAVAEGAATIQVSSEGKSATVAVTVNPTPVASINITPSALALSVGQTTRLTAQALDAQGKPLANRSYAWSSDAPSVATVNQLGDVTAISNGNVTIRAASGGQTGLCVVSVSVTSVAVASINISPKPVALFPNQVQQLTVQFLDSAGGSLNAAGRTVTWLSRDPTIVTVSSSGQVGGIAVGSTYVLASTAGATATLYDSVSVSVSAAPISSTSVQPKANALYVGGSTGVRAVVVNGGVITRTSAVTWQSRSASIVSVSPVSGFPDSATVTGVSLGSAYVVATDPGGLSDSSLFTVTTAPVASVAVTPASASIAVNTTTQLSATATDAAGGTVTPTITWVSLAPTIASVTSTGLVTATSSGSATIEARAMGAGANGVDVVGNAAITVTPPAQAPVNTVIVTSPRSWIVPGDTMHLTVVLRDGQNNILTGRLITFSSNNSQMSVDAAGVVTGIATSGASDIVATSEGKTGKVHIDANAGASSMTVAGPQGNATDLLLNRGQKKRYTVTVLDANGVGVNGATITISSNNPGVLTLQKTVTTTNSAGEAHLDITGNTAGLATVTFTATRGGAIPPGSAGNNNPVALLPLVVP